MKKKNVYVFKVTNLSSYLKNSDHILDTFYRVPSKF